jgi:hypothetical protein
MFGKTAQNVSKIAHYIFSAYSSIKILSLSNIEDATQRGVKI